jgi:hypothetical protein
MTVMVSSCLPSIIREKVSKQREKEPGKFFLVDIMGRIETFEDEEEANDAFKSWLEDRRHPTMHYPSKFEKYELQHGRVTIVTNVKKEYSYRIRSNRKKQTY